MQDSSTMKAHLQAVVMCLLMFAISSSYPYENNTTQIEERKGLNFNFIAQFQEFTKHEAVQAGLPRFVGTFGGVSSTMVSAHKKISTKQKIKEIGDAIVPMIQFGLACLPGGALIGGVVAGIWGLIGPIFGKSPMQELIEGMQKELDDIKLQIKELAEKLTEQFRKETDEKLRSIISKGIQGEIERNDYICSKYAIISKKFIREIKEKKEVNETLRFEMIVHLNDCDNFLKDTAGMYLFEDYADVLWLPSIVTTLARVSFLTEVANYGMYLKLEEEMLVKFWTELKFDIVQLFEFSHAAVRKRLESLMGFYIPDSALNFTSMEYEGCKIQSTLLYFDREFYPYGAPSFFRISDNNTVVNVSTFNTSTIQIYYNGIPTDNNYYFETMLNCINGQSVITSVPLKEMSFIVTYVPNNSYQVRVLYFVKEIQYSYRAEIHYAYDLISKSRHVKVDHDGSTIKMMITTGEASNSSAERFLVKTAYHGLRCNRDLHYNDLYGRRTDKRFIQSDGKCVSQQQGYYGTYVIENVVGFNVLPGMELNGKIVVLLPDDNFAIVAKTLILGVELIVRPIRVD